MRIFAVTPLYPPRSRVGAWLATHDFLAALAQRGHEVTVMPWMSGGAPYDLDGVHVVPKSRAVTEYVAAAHVVISHLGDNGLAHRLATGRGVPSVLMAHSPVVESGRRLQGARLVVANSKATAKALEWTGPLIICPPPTWRERHETIPGDAVTLVNLSAPKGGELFWILAERLPDIEFLGVAGGYGHQITHARPNVTVLPTQADMRVVWGQTRVLLMPSIREAWGMTALEAMCSGIPVIAHPTEGLRESLGTAATFIDRDDVAGWERMIRSFTSRPTAWDVASRLARQRAATLEPATSIAQFVLAVEAHVGVSV